MQARQELLAALHDGPFEQPLWSSFLLLLRAECRADYAGLNFHPRHAHFNATIELFAGEAAPEAMRRLYQEESYRLDPFRTGMEARRVYALPDLLDMTEPGHRAFYDAVLAPRGMVFMRAMRVLEPGGVHAWLSVSRSKSDFSPTVGKLLASLARDLEWALRSYLAIDRARFNTTVTSDALQRLNFGWISLDAACGIMEVSAHAENIMLHSTGIGRDPAGRLVLASPAIQAELRSIVASFEKNPQARPRALHVASDPWTDILLLPPQDGVLSAAPRPTAIAFIQGDHRSAASRRDRIAELFGLTPSEARLTLALSRGRSITEAAADLGLAVQTARSYSKAIYAKVGARGQTDLVRFILASVLMLT